MQAVILAAGEGKRVRPLTWSRPKAMIPVANRPIIGYVIDALVKNGIRDIIVVVGYRKEQVTRFLNQLDIPVKVVVQDKQLGTAHALRQAESEITGDFLVLPGDNYIDPQSIARIKDEHDAILVKEHPNPSNFGVVLLKEGNVESIVEKPDHAPSFMVSTGIYSLKKDFFTFIDGNNTVTDTITRMLEAERHIKAIIADDWQDAIYPWDLLKMNERLLCNLPAVREGTTSRNTTIKGAVRIGKGTTIGPHTVITGPVVIGNNCTISPNCCILPNTSIGSRVAIEPFLFLTSTCSTISKTSFSRGMPPPGLPWKWIAALSRTESLTSSIIWPKLISTTRNSFVFSAAFARTAYGKGHRVTGRIMPTLSPLSRAAFMTALQMRAVVP